MTSAAELRVIAARVRPFLPREAERLIVIAAEHHHMADALDSIFQQHRRDEAAKEAFGRD
jgi:hypothetical protein